MSQDELVLCVMGCASPCGCLYCEVMSVPLHEPVPNRAVAPGRLCGRCRGRLWRILDGLGGLMSELSLDVLARGLSDEGGGERVKGSPALIRLDVLALIDPRTMYEAKRRSDGSISTGPVHVWAAVYGWASSLRDSMAGDSINSGDSYGSLQDLRDGFEDLVAMPWIDDCLAELGDIWRLVNRAIGTESARPIGRCVTTWPAHWLSKDRTAQCGQPVFDEGGLSAQCSRCGTRYRGMGLVEMALQQRGIEQGEREQWDLEG